MEFNFGKVLDLLTHPIRIILFSSMLLSRIKINDEEIHFQKAYPR